MEQVAVAVFGERMRLKVLHDAVDGSVKARGVLKSLAQAEVDGRNVGKRP